jgi:gluconate 2-dehydrogenase gamma chain
MSVNRRELLPILAAGLAAPVSGQHFHASTDPLLATDQYKLRFFDATEHRQLDCLAEMIIPADATSGGAHDAHVANYIDLVVSYEKTSHQKVWREGLKSINEASRSRFGKPILELSPAQRDTVLSPMAAQEENPGTPEEHFFVLLKNMVIDGYRISPVGMTQWMGWKGHPGGLYPGCDDHTKP